MQSDQIDLKYDEQDLQEQQLNNYEAVEDFSSNPQRHKADTVFVHKG